MLNSEDIPTIVAQEIVAAHKAGIPPADLPEYIKDRIRHRLAGDVSYVRKRDLSPRERSAEVKRRFNGRNQRELAQALGITIRRVQQIISERE